MSSGNVWSAFSCELSEASDTLDAPAFESAFWVTFTAKRIPFLQENGSARKAKVSPEFAGLAEQKVAHPIQELLPVQSAECQNDDAFNKNCLQVSVLVRANISRGAWSLGVVISSAHAWLLLRATLGPLVTGMPGVSPEVGIPQGEAGDTGYVLNRGNEHIEEAWKSNLW